MLPLPFIANAICTGKRGICIIQSDHQVWDASVVQGCKSSLQWAEHKHGSFQRKKTPQRLHSIYRMGLTLCEQSGEEWVIKNCWLCGRAQNFWREGSWYRCTVESEIALFHSGYEEFDSVIAWLLFFPLLLLHCFKQKSHKIYYG